MYKRQFPTGGTTGLSKAAEWSLQTWETMVSTFWQCMPCDVPPVHLVAGPMTHAAGVLAFCCLTGGATNVILPKADPALILDAIERHGITHLYLPPTLIYSLLDQPGVRDRDYSSLRYMVVAAAPISPIKLREAVEVFGPVVCQSYGQAEAPMFMTVLPTRDLIAGPETVSYTHLDVYKRQISDRAASISPIAYGESGKHSKRAGIAGRSSSFAVVWTSVQPFRLP